MELEIFAMNYGYCSIYIDNCLFLFFFFIAFLPFYQWKSKREREKTTFETWTQKQQCIALFCKFYYYKIIRLECSLNLTGSAVRWIERKIGLTESSSRSAKWLSPKKIVHSSYAHTNTLTPVNQTESLESSTNRTQYDRWVADFTVYIECHVTRHNYS